MNSLPFLNQNKLPKLRKQSGESRYGFSEDDELCESLVKELKQALESKDHSKLMSSIEALIECIMNKNEEGEDAIDS